MNSGSDDQTKCCLVGVIWLGNSARNELSALERRKKKEERILSVTDTDVGRIVSQFSASVERVISLYIIT